MATLTEQLCMDQDLQQEGLLGKRRIVKDPRLMTTKDRVPIYLLISYCALCNDYEVLHEHEQYEDNSDPLDYDNADID